ncbi:MAG: hypothetical protein J5765_02040, partial [Clostridia bacterium]|nr:hypothetical protein [Clostridia bacterium]
MTKNLHTKILLILLLCFAVALVAFACAPKTTTVVPSSGGSSGGGSSGGGSSTSQIDVDGGEKTDSSVDEFFSYLKEALAVEDESDTLAFKFVSEDMTVVESGKTFNMYALFECKYNRKKDSETELLFELYSSATREAVFGLYYVNSVFYLNVPNDEGGVSVYMDEFSLHDLLTVADGVYDKVSGMMGDVMSIDIPNFTSVGTLINNMASSAIRSVTKIEKGDATRLVLKTNINKTLNYVLSLLGNPVVSSLLEGFQVDAILTSAFGISLTTIANYTFETITCDFTVDLQGGKLVSIDADLGYGADIFVLDFTVDNQYYGTSGAEVGTINFPEFNDYRKFGVTNLEFTFRLELNNETEKQVTVENLIGGVLREYFGLDSLGSLSERTLTLGAGTLGLLIDVNAELDWNKNERNYIEMEIYEMRSAGNKRLGTVYYVGSRNALYVDLSALNMPKFVYEGINLATTINSFITETMASLLGTAEENSAAGEETRQILIDTFAPGGSYSDALSAIVQNGTYEFVAEAGEGKSYAKLDVFSLIVRVVKTMERKPGGRKAIALTLDREAILSIVSGLANTAKKDLDSAIANAANSAVVADYDKRISDNAKEIKECEARIAALTLQLEQAVGIGEEAELNGKIKTAREQLAELNKTAGELAEARQAEIDSLAKKVKSAQDKFDLFASIYDGVNPTLSSTDVAIRQIRVELGILGSGFGIYLDAQIKLAEDTFLTIAVDRLSIGYAPTFIVPKESFSSAGYDTLEEFTGFSVSTVLSLSGDTGSLTELNLGDALGGVIGELTCVLGVKEPLSGGLDLKVDANVAFSPVAMSDLISGANTHLTLSGVDLALNIYKRVNATTSDMSEANRILSIWYGEYAAGETAVFVDATNLSLSADGTTLPKFMYRIRLEDYFAGALSAETEYPSMPAAAASSLSTEQLVEIFGNIFGGLYIGDELSVALADRTLAA